MTAIGKAIQYEYKALHKPNQLIYGQGQTAVITGWTVKQAIAKHLHPQEYAVIGQLYSPTRGLNFLIRNLLFNPHVRYLVYSTRQRKTRTRVLGSACWTFSAMVLKKD
jgi:thymidylate synthase